MIIINSLKKKDFLSPSSPSPSIVVISSAGYDRPPTSTPYTSTHIRSHSIREAKQKPFSQSVCKLAFVRNKVSTKKNT